MMKGKKVTKRVIAALLVFVFVASALCGCGSKESSKGNSNKEVSAVTFPLKEKVTFKMMVPQTETASFKTQLANNKLWKDLEEKTNVHIEFQFLGDAPAEKFSLLVNSKEYGDFLFGNVLNTSAASKYIAAGLFQDLTDYITPEIMPQLCGILEEVPALKKGMTAEDGNMYTIVTYNGALGNALESPIWINKAWLDKLGLAIPTTIDEFTNCLRAFRDRDPNGNGQKDEIPYICSTNGGYMNVEVLMGMFGIATKDGLNDAYVQVVDGKVKFVPTLPAYKDAINYLATLYKEGLMWNQAFTASSGDVDGKLTSTTCVVGCFTKMTPSITDYKDDYVCIAPPKAPGYEQCWYYNPGGEAGIKNMFYVMDKCENTNILLAWIDQLLNFETGMRATQGEPDDGYYTVDADGKISMNTLDYATSKKLSQEKPVLNSIIGSWMRIFTSKDYENNIKSWSDVEQYKRNYDMYKPYINTELWLRPYYASEEAYDADLYFTDIDYQVTQKRAAWITGRSDINKEWDAFQKKLNDLGLQDYLKILQRAHDATQKVK